jgi:crotonobetainyl-CoA:carnitine CoA-transferase CaiB-like acyl-CoA transferase
MHANSNKLGVTLDLARPKGLALLEQLIARCDVVVENFTPRVLEQFGLGWERVRALNPRAILMRMPAFGLTGPWRDHTGFAQTMEQMTGLAWVTGHAHDQPRIPRGPCDPIAAMHAAFALLVALEERAATGRGLHVESTMVESALGIAAEQVVEWSAYGRRMEREGNRSALAAPQGLYACADGPGVVDKWLALSVATDAQWRALRELLGSPAWATDPALDTREGRRRAHDAIDAQLRVWVQGRDRDALVAALRARGIPASPVVNASRVLRANPQLAARGYFETPAHPVVGPMPLPTLPFRFASVSRWIRTPAPTLGQHNGAVLSTMLGLSPEALRELEAEGVIGTRPARL